MTVHPYPDQGPADWLKKHYWSRFAVRGPQSFAQYARLRFTPDPQCDGQPYADLEAVEGPAEIWQLGIIVDMLAQHTSTPQECFYAIWSGWSGLNAHGAATFAIPGRSYSLFRGTAHCLPHDPTYPYADETKDWQLPIPTLIWPSDHAWFITNDLDPHFATIGASEAAIATLLTDTDTDSRIDIVVDKCPEHEPPYYG
ncbi:hypothetical protein ACPXCG_23850 [Gordonia sp. DT218]|uniref:hypothetical protein n=1 Tax=Gordonia sp. DT218 TaxID=3416659 RepID=UPI003CF28DA4